MIFFYQLLLISIIIFNNTSAMSSFFFTEELRAKQIEAAQKEEAMLMRKIAEEDNLMRKIDQVRIILEGQARIFSTKNQPPASQKEFNLQCLDWIRRKLNHPKMPNKIRKRHDTFQALILNTLRIYRIEMNKKLYEEMMKHSEPNNNIRFFFRPCPTDIDEFKEALKWPLEKKREPRASSPLPDNDQQPDKLFLSKSRLMQHLNREEKPAPLTETTADPISKFPPRLLTTDQQDQTTSPTTRAQIIPTILASPPQTPKPANSGRSTFTPTLLSASETPSSSSSDVMLIPQPPKRR